MKTFKDNLKGIPFSGVPKISRSWFNGKLISTDEHDKLTGYDKKLVQERNAQVARRNKKAEARKKVSKKIS